MKSYSESYAEAGVDVTAGYKAVELMKRHIARTQTPGVQSDVGGFGSVFDPEFLHMKHPVFVSGADGVGTKLKLAFLMDKHDTVGIDCVAMCVNDVICCGAQPLFFLDYLACGKNEPEKVAGIVGGVAEGCVQSGCALIGGETAEMPGFYPPDEYDLAGFCVGAVERGGMITPDRVKLGDIIIALPSSGIHSNGFSLIRKIFNLRESSVNTYVDELGKTLGEELLTPTKIYVAALRELIRRCDVHGVAHITGGGFFENIPRMLGEGQCARIERDSVLVLPVFNLIMRMGNIPERDMFGTFNMGVGMTVTVPPADADAAINLLRAAGVDAYPIGEVAAGERETVLC